MTAIISYLRAQKPVSNKVPANSLNILGNVVKAFMIKPVGPDGPVPTSVKKDTTVEYGKYLALNVANCKGCHTERDLSGTFTGELFAGGNDIDGFITPNITTDSSSRMAGWSQGKFHRPVSYG